MPDGSIDFSNAQEDEHEDDRTGSLLWRPPP